MSPERALAILSAWPLLWGCVHAFEQAAVFRGRLEWLARVRVTSLPVVEIPLAILPALLWAALVLRALLRREALPGTTDSSPLARALAAVQPIATLVAVAFVVGHIAWLWLPGVFGAPNVEAYDAMQRGLGVPWVLATHAVGLTAFAWHTAASLPHAADAVGIAPTATARESLRWIGIVLAVLLFVHFAQMVGWLGTGTGTFWPIEVVPAHLEAP